MHHTAYLSRSAVEAGASLVIVGNQLVTGDTLDVNTPGKDVLRLTVSAFGLARLVVSSPSGHFECRPWKRDDEALLSDPGAASRWTIGKQISG